MKLNKFILPIIVGLSVAACSETAPVDSPQTEGSPIVLSARTDEGGSVDTRVEDGEVVDGNYYLSFTNTDEDLQTVSAPFRDGTGYPWVDGAGENGEGEALHWGYIQRPANDNVTLYLDNVAGEANEKNVVILDKNDVYQASVYDAATSENDIVWGRKTNVKYDAKNVDFTLSHRMACVRVNIQVDIDDGGDQNVSESITQHGVIVSLLNVRYKASQFNRTTGKVTENTTETNIKLHDGKLVDSGYTFTWIFPPQSFSDSYRPILQIKLKDGSGTTYEGGLPESMFGNNDYLGTAYDLAFSAGQLLTINVKLVTSIADREILFLPAVVEDWTHLDPIDIVPKQLGIYSDEDYNDVVKAYNNEEGIDAETMKRYATYDEETKKWIVNIFAEIGTGEELTDNNKFNNNTSITLVFNGYTVYGKNANSQSWLFANYDSGETEGGEDTGGDESGEEESGGDENTDGENQLTEEEVQP